MIRTRLSRFFALMVIFCAGTLAPTTAAQPVLVQRPDVAIFRLFAQNGEDGDALYTTSSQEMQTSGYKVEGLAGKCFSSQVAGTIPLFRMYNQQETDHFYTTSVKQSEAAKTAGFRGEGVLCYVYAEQVAGSCPLYRLYSGTPATNHLYTLSRAEVEAAILKGPAAKVAGDRKVNYSEEGIEGYIFPYNSATCPK
jgi:Repeat of unknown function (DUF5648)